jgi:hypothetical protein
MIFYFENSNNTVQSIQSLVYMLSSNSSFWHGYYVCETNFRQNITMYIARCRDLIDTNWINQADVYQAPFEGYGNK